MTQSFNAIDELVKEYELWTQANSLPLISADELVYEANERNMTSEQITYLYDFIERWEDVTNNNSEV